MIKAPIFVLDPKHSTLSAKVSAQLVVGGAREVTGDLGSTTVRV